MYLNLFSEWIHSGGAVFVNILVIIYIFKLSIIKFWILFTELKEDNQCDQTEAEHGATLCVMFLYPATIYWFNS